LNVGPLKADLAQKEILPSNEVLLLCFGSVGGKKGGPGGRREKPQNRRKWKGGSPLR